MRSQRSSESSCRVNERPPCEWRRRSSGEFAFEKRSPERVLRTLSRTAQVRTKSPGLVLRRGSCDFVRCCVRRVIPIPRGGRESTMGGTIPFVPPVSTGKTVTPRCHSVVARTRDVQTGSVTRAARERARQELVTAVLRRKCTRPQRVTICCECASWANRDGRVKERRRKNSRARKKKTPPPVPCGSSFGNPLIERGASPSGFGSHYSPNDERRGWACERRRH